MPASATPSLDLQHPRISQDSTVTELLAAAGAGDPDAWTELLRRYGRWVSAIARSFRFQDADVLDVEQRTWLRLLENHQRIRDPEHLGSWLATTASRECLAVIRDRRAVGDLLDSDAVVDPACVEQEVVDALTASRLWTLVDTLPERPRAIMTALFADDPPPYAELARTLDIPIGSVGPTRARVLARLRRMFDGEPIVFGPGEGRG